MTIKRPLVVMLLRRRRKERSDKVDWIVMYAQALAMFQYPEGGKVELKRIGFVHPKRCICTRSPQDGREVSCDIGHLEDFLSTKELNAVVGKLNLGNVPLKDELVLIGRLVQYGDFGGGPGMPRAQPTPINGWQESFETKMWFVPNKAIDGSLTFSGELLLAGQIKGFPTLA